MEDRELLVRIDERLQNLTAPGGDIAEIKSRLVAINSNCVEHSEKISKNGDRITKTETRLTVLWTVFVSFLVAAGTSIARLWTR